MRYFPQFEIEKTTLTLSEILNALKSQGLISEETILSQVNRYCYCEDGDYCSCFPEEFIFDQYTVKPNHCDTCGATGREICKTISGKRVSGYHKNRKVI